MSMTSPSRRPSRSPSRRPLRTGWTLGLACIGTFVAALDVVVVSTALPTLRTQLDASLPDLEWTINAYNLAFACLMLTGAALGDRFGRVRVYVLGLTVFTLASAACALSASVEVLIAARVIQGAGAAVILPLSLTLISEAFPMEKRGAAIGIWGGVTGLGVAAGPVVGGAIIQGISWQWIFWINVPVGVVAAVLSAALLRESYGPRPQLDLIGLLLVALAFFGLTWAPIRAISIGWDSGEVIGSLIGGAVLLAGFLSWENRVKHPMLPLGYFKSRGFATANGVVFFQQVSLIGSLFLITQLFQLGLGYDAWETGLRILVWTGMPMLVAPIAGALADRLGNRPFMVGGLGWLALAVEPGVSYARLIGPLIVAGVGISMCFPTVANAVVGSVPLNDSGVAAGTNNALREIGGVFGVAMVSAVFVSYGNYSSPENFVSGFRAAEFVAAAVSFTGVIAAVLSPSKKNAALPQPELSQPELSQADAVVAGLIAKASTAS
jgi:EmrB/QacA subfamily drug resistance transporter